MYRLSVDKSSVPTFAVSRLHNNGNVKVGLVRETAVSLGVQSWEKMTCAVCARTMLADSDMSPVYTLPLVYCVHL